MAEKKFFVDLNLQGNKLANSVVGANSSMTTGGSFRYAEGRLEYFDGATVQEVANLADISAVTGGLIFQGGYDASTDTPDITDGTALKGFFWAVSTAGSFLGESVQVGDSLVAKVDNAGATIADWLILQGNIVIATDSVDGIVRLATQTEANAGTEGGAVVITPATLQGKIDAQVTPEINNKLPLAGGTMSGTLDMNFNTITNAQLLGASLDGTLNASNNSITNVGAPTNGGDAANKTYVDDQDALKLSLSGGTMSGNLDMAGYVLDNADITNASLSTALNAGGNAINNIPAPTANGDAANKQYVDDAQAAAELYADGLAVNYDAAGSAATAQANAESFATTAANNAQTAAEAYADSLAPNYDAAGAAATAQANAEAYADSLAPNYDAAGSAATAETNANNYTDTEIAKLSNVFAIETTDWLLNGGTYEVTVSHGVTALSISAQFMDLLSGDFAEFAYTTSPTNITVKSNFIPSDAIRVLAYGAN